MADHAKQHSLTFRYECCVRWMVLILSLWTDQDNIFCGELICFVARLAQNKTGRALKAIDQLYLVAGAGFEPTTFGL